MKNIEIEKAEVKHSKSAASANPAGQPPQMAGANVPVDPVLAIVKANRGLLEIYFQKQTITKVINGGYGSNTKSYENIVNKLRELGKL